MKKSRTRTRSTARRLKTGYRETFRQTWAKMGIKARIVLVGSVFAGIVFASQATGVLTGTYHAVRPYAERATEVVLAGWQYDRALSELRDVKESIRRLENKKKRLAATTRQHPRGQRLNKDDDYFLDRLYRDRKRLEKMLKYIDQKQRPYAK